MQTCQSKFTNRHESMPKDNRIKKSFCRSKNPNLKLLNYTLPFLLWLVKNFFLQKIGRYKMENVATVINHVMHDMTYYASNKKAYHEPCYETINKRDYVRLLNQLDAWNVYAPKALVKKYGVKTVQLAVEYTKSTPNVRVPGAYFTYMLRQLKTKNVEPPQKPQAIEKQETVTNIPKEQKTSCKLSQLPQIENWKDARKFLCDYMDGAYKETDNVISFVKEIKRRYNFG